MVNALLPLVSTSKYNYKTKIKKKKGEPNVNVGFLQFTAKKEFIRSIVTCFLLPQS